MRTYQRNFEKLLESLGTPRRGFHALRHTFVTRAIECDMDIKMLSEILGHKSPSVTEKIYAHFEEEQHITSAEIISKTLSFE